MLNSTTLINIPPADIDDIFHYKLYPGTTKRTIDDHCRIRLFHRSKTVCIITELANSGMSVTNSIEKIIDQLFWLFEQECHPLPKDTIFIEHYGSESYQERDDYPDSFDLVTIKDKRPLWKSLSYSEVREILA